MFSNNDFKTISKIILDTKWNENELISTSNFIVQKFPGTAFDSDYKCFKVTKNVWFQSPSSSLRGKTLSYKVVAKITNKSEYIILNELYNSRFNVPKIYCCATLSHQTNKILLFEEYIDGNELFCIQNNEKWIESIKNWLKFISNIGLISLMNH